MLRFTFNLLLSFFALTIIASAGIAWYVLPKLPNIETLREVRMQVPLRIYSHDRSLIAEFGEKRRKPVEIESVTTLVINAILAAEDDRFYQHPGVDWQGILRATISLIKTGTKKQGGSTITMQVARNFFLSREKTYLRKLNEIFLAMKIERELSKDDILELYINKIYLGQRAYGVAAAAQIYYGSDIDELSLPQVAMIAGLPKAPSTTNPVSNPERALARRNYVLRRMLKLGFITEEEFEQASSTPVSATLHNPFIQIEAPYVAEMVRRSLLDEYGEDAYTNGLNVTTTLLDRNQIAANRALRMALLEYDQRHGYRGPEHHYELDSMDIDDDKAYDRLLETYPILGNLYPALIVDIREKSVTAFLTGIGQVDIEWPGLSWAHKYITENRRGPKPKNAAEIVQIGDIVRLVETAEGKWQLSQIPAIEGGLVSLRPVDGATLALVGGFDFQRSKFNRVIQARRQPGSGFKPFIYSAALAAGKTAASLINDAPVVFDDPGIEDKWRPENYSHKNYGPTRLREALTHSRNLVSIRLLHAIGVPFALEHISRFGFNIDQLPKNLSLALGSGEITPWEQARGFSVFANGGHLIDPYYIESIKTYDEAIVYQADPKIVCKECDDIGQDINLHPDMTDTADDKELTMTNYAPRVVTPQNIWIMNSMTRDVIQHGTGRRALVLGRKDLSGKTGTTNDQHDAWFSGFNSDIVTVAWVGFDKFLPLGSRETGARAALPMWNEYMRTALEGMPASIMDRPPGLVNVRIDPATGKQASSSNPDAIFEVFRSKQVPQEIPENRHSNIFLDEDNKETIPEQLF
ncbi:MAG: penicillin-binding protein 1A [Gammaproteobacteria bacterium]